MEPQILTPTLETLESNEIALTNGTLDIDVPLSAFEQPAGAMDVSGNLAYEVGRFKALSGDGIFYNQLEIDRYACTLVSAFTALANSTGKVPSYDTIRTAFDAYVASGKFTPNVGGYMTDGAYFATQAFNEAFGTNIKYVVRPFNIDEEIKSLQNGFLYNFLIKYGKDFSKNEQDDGIIQAGSGVVGNQGHCVCGCVVNTTAIDEIDPATGEKIGLQRKYLENYHDIVKYDIIYCRPNDYPSLFGSTLITYTV